MAIVKLNYLRNRGKIKAALGYDAHRVSRDKEKMSRVFFGYGGVIDEDQAYRMIDNAKKGTLLFRIIISPDPRTEDTQKDLDLWQIARQTMLCLEERLKNEVQFIAAEHNDHTDIRHIHAVVLLRGRVNPEDLQALREAATLTALSQRQARDAALSLLIQPEQSVEQSGNPRSTSFQHS